MLLLSQRFFKVKHISTEECGRSGLKNVDPNSRACIEKIQWPLTLEKVDVMWITNKGLWSSGAPFSPLPPHQLFTPLLVLQVCLYSIIHVSLVHFFLPEHRNLYISADILRTQILACNMGIDWRENGKCLVTVEVWALASWQGTKESRCVEDKNTVSSNRTLPF